MILEPENAAPTSPATQPNAALVRYNPDAPIGSPSNLKALLDKNAASLQALLPKHVTPDRIIKTMLVAVNRNPGLLTCTQASVFETIQRAAELGLDLSGTLGEAYPAPFRNRVKAPGGNWVDQEQATLIIGYRGLAKLARQSGEVECIEAEPVYESDHFIFQKGSEFKVEYRPCLRGDRGNLFGFYSYVRFKDGGQQAEFMSVEQIESVKAKSRSSGKGPWVDHYDEMGRKTVFRRLAKWLPLSSEKFVAALTIDNDDFPSHRNAAVFDLGMPDTGDLPVATKPKTSGSYAAPVPEPQADPKPEPKLDDGPQLLSPDRVIALSKLAAERGLDADAISADICGSGLDGAPASFDAQIMREIEKREPKKGGRS